MSTYKVGYYFSLKEITMFADRDALLRMLEAKEDQSIWTLIFIDCVKKSKSEQEIKECMKKLDGKIQNNDIPAACKILEHIMVHDIKNTAFYVSRMQKLLRKNKANIALIAESLYRYFTIAEQITKRRLLDKRINDFGLSSQLAKEIKRIEKLMSKNKKTFPTIGNRERELPLELLKIPEWLSKLAKDECPEELQKYKIKTCDLCEFYVHQFFLKICGLTTCKQWGSEYRFEHVPDGFFKIPNENNAVLYDAKAAINGYRCGNKDLLNFADYIKEHREEMRYFTNLGIKYFLLISSDFKGDINTHANRFYKEANVSLIFCSIDILLKFIKDIEVLSKKQTGESEKYKGLIRWEDIFSNARPLITEKLCKKEVDRISELRKKY